MTSTLGKLDSQPWVSAAIEDLKSLQAVNIPLEEDDEATLQVVFDLVEDYLLKWGQALPLRTPKPYIDLAANGDVCLTWRTGEGKRLDIEFDNAAPGKFRGALLLDGKQEKIRHANDVVNFLKRLMSPECSDK